MEKFGVLSVQEIKNRINSMLAQKAEATLRGHRLAPSMLWDECIQYLNYVRELPEQCLGMIRMHAGPLVGWPWFQYIGRGDRLLVDIEQKKTIKEIQLYDLFTHDVPENLYLSEPVNDPLLEVLGIEYIGRLINFDIVRYQTCITNLYFDGPPT